LTRGARKIISQFLSSTKFLFQKISQSVIDFKLDIILPQKNLLQPLFNAGSDEKRYKLLQEILFVEN
jgi:hypothetical protein